MFYKYYLKIKSRFFYNFMYLNIVTDPSKPDYLKRDHISPYKHINIEY